MTDTEEYSFPRSPSLPPIADCDRETDDDLKSMLTARHGEVIRISSEHAQWIHTNAALQAAFNRIANAQQEVA